MKSEHAMGYIKGRFCSLRGLRQQIDNSRDHELALIWVKTCIIIHTLVSVIEQGDEDEDFISELVEEGIDDERNMLQSEDSIGGLSDMQREMGGTAKRTQLKYILLKNLSYS